MRGEGIPPSATAIAPKNIHPARLAPSCRDWAPPSWPRPLIFEFYTLQISQLTEFGGALSRTPFARTRIPDLPIFENQDGTTNNLGGRTYMVPCSCSFGLVFWACLQISFGLWIGARRAPGGPARRFEEKFNTLEDDGQRVPCCAALGRSL